MPIGGNLLCSLPDATGDEKFETLLIKDGVRIERIVSRGQATAPGEWYDQAGHEWVLLLAGEALLELEGEAVPRRLVTGQWVMLPAYCRHRVVWTAAGVDTVWLAIHWPVQVPEIKGAHDVANHD